MSTIESDLKDILLDDLFVERTKDQIGIDESLRQDLGVDSLGFVELKAQVEERYDIEISDDDFTPENFATIATVASLVERCRAAA